MEYLDLTGLQALWQKTKELVSARSCVLTYPTNGETITTDTYNKIVSAVASGLPIVVIKQASDTANEAHMCTTAQNTNGVITLVWFSTDNLTKYTCTISTAKKVTLTSTAVNNPSSSDNVYVFDTATVSNNTLTQAQYDALKSAVVANKTILVLSDSKYVIVTGKKVDTNGILLEFISTTDKYGYTFNISASNRIVGIAGFSIDATSASGSSSKDVISMKMPANGSTMTTDQASTLAAAIDNGKVLMIYDDDKILSADGGSSIPASVSLTDGYFVSFITNGLLYVMTTDSTKGGNTDWKISNYSLTGSNDQQIVVKEVPTNNTAFDSTWSQLIADVAHGNKILYLTNDDLNYDYAQDYQKVPANVVIADDSSYFEVSWMYGDCIYTASASDSSTKFTVTVTPYKPYIFDYSDLSSPTEAGVKTLLNELYDAYTKNQEIYVNTSATTALLSRRRINTINFVKTTSAGLQRCTFDINALASNGKVTWEFVTLTANGTCTVSKYTITGTAES